MDRAEDKRKCVAGLMDVAHLVGRVINIFISAIPERKDCMF